MNDKRDGGWAHSELFTKPCQSDASSTVYPRDLSHLIRVKNPSSVRITASYTSLLGSVRHVVGLSPKKEVPWIYAKWVVTFVKNKKALHDRPVVNNPGNPVGEGSNPFRRRVSSKRPIPTPQAPSPRPAFLNSIFFDVLPKSVNVIGSDIDLFGRIYKALFRFVHTNPMFEFSGACSAATGTRYEFKEVS